MNFKLNKISVSKNNDVNPEVILMWALLLVYVSLCVSGVLDFELWAQVVDIWEEGYTNISLMNNPHALRFYLVLPVFLLSEMLDIDYNYLFSNIVPILIYFSVLNINKVVCDVVMTSRLSERSIAFVFSYVILCGISFFMNGRILFAILASFVLLYIVYFWGKLSVPSIIKGWVVGLLLSSVSSGTFIVFVLSFFVVSFYYALNSFSKKNIIMLSFSIVLFMLATPLVIMFLLKNINFYGGGVDGFISMFSHGIGAVLFEGYDFSVVLLSALIIALLIIMAVIIFVYYKWLRTFLLLISISIFGGMFGYSTMMMGLAPIIALISCILMFSFKALHGKGVG